MPQCIPAGQLTLHVLGKRKRLPITTSVTRLVILNNPLRLFVATFLRGGLNSHTCGGSTCGATVPLPWPCRLGGTQCFRAGDKIRNVPQIGPLATQPLPSWGYPKLQSGRQNQNWPTIGQIGYITPAVWCPQRCSGGQNQKRPTNGQICDVTPAVRGRGGGATHQSRDTVNNGPLLFYCVIY